MQTHGVGPFGEQHKLNRERSEEGRERRPGAARLSNPPSLLGDDEKLILCDECNKAFHLFCLRPALYRIPVGEWRCPACQPTVARRGSRSR